MLNTSTKCALGLGGFSPIPLISSTSKKSVRFYRQPHYTLKIARWCLLLKKCNNLTSTETAHTGMVYKPWVIDDTEPESVFGSMRCSCYDTKMQVHTTKKRRPHIHMLHCSSPYSYPQLSILTPEFYNKSTGQDIEANRPVTKIKVWSTYNSDNWASWKPKSKVSLINSSYLKLLCRTPETSSKVFVCTICQRRKR